MAGAPSSPSGDGGRGFATRALVGVVLGLLGSALFPELVHDAAVRPLVYRLTAPPAEPTEPFLWPDEDEVASSAQAQQEPQRAAAKADEEEDEEDGEEDGEEPKPERAAAQQASGAGADGRKFDVTFVNKWKGGATSLFWVDNEDEFHMIINSFKGPSKVGTFVGHRFAFTAEGTKDQVGETVTIRPGVVEYTLGAEAQRHSEVGDKCR
jgi:hypothetical protein